VIDEAGALAGIVTEGDFLRRAETGTQRQRPRWLEFLAGPGKLASEYVHASGRKVSEVMTANVQTVGEDASLDEVVGLMERHRVKRVPVMRNGKVVGIITRANLLRALASVAPELAPATADDRAIRERLLAELKRQPWAPVAMIDATVRNGVVSLSGCVLDERQRDAVRVVAENVPGVKSIEDHLVWIEPMSGAVIESPQDRAAAAAAQRRAS
jgi:CBS-domain-containing membrane protein